MPLSEPPDRQVVEFYESHQRNVLGIASPPAFLTLDPERKLAYRNATATYNVVVERNQLLAPR